MARLPARGVAIATPFQDGPQRRPLTEDDLRCALSEISPGVEFSSTEISEFFSHLAVIVGLWVAEQERLDSGVLARKVSKISKTLEAIGAELSGNETGLRTNEEMELAAQLTDLLSLDPTLGSQEAARTLMDRFIGDAKRISHACRVAAVDLKARKSPSGRPTLLWHDEFARLLVSIAEKSNIDPQLWRDRVDQSWRGWLFDASSRLEIFLPKGMLSGTDEARGKRLARSRQRSER